MNRGNSVVVRQVNEDIIRSALVKCRCATKMTLSEITGLSLMTVSSVIKKLEQVGEIIEDEMVPSEGGRPSRSYRYNDSWSFVITVFISSHEKKDMVYISVANAFGNIVWHEKAAVSCVDKEVFKPFIDKAIKLFPQCRAIGMGVPGIVSEGYVAACDYRMLDGVNLAEIYSLYCGIPVILDNDVNCAVLGYCSSLGYSEEKNKTIVNSLSSSNFLNDCCDETDVYIFFPGKSAPGSGIWINGSLYRGNTNRAGEIGWLPDGINWSDEALYKNDECFVKAVAYLIHIFISVLAPERVILSSTFLTHELFERICAEYKANSNIWWYGTVHGKIDLSEDSRNVKIDNTNTNSIKDSITNGDNKMEILLSENFEEDYSNGLIRLAQNLLAPKYEIQVRNV